MTHAPCAADPAAALSAIADPDRPAAEAADALAAWLGAEPAAAAARLEALAARTVRGDREGDRLATLLVAAAPPETRLLERAWRCTGLDRLDAAAGAALLQAAAGPGPSPLAGDVFATGADLAEALRAAAAPLVAARAAGTPLKDGERTLLATVVALDADLWERRRRAVVARDAGRPGAGARDARWRVEGADRRRLAAALADHALAPSAEAGTSRLRWTLGPDGMAGLRAAAEDRADLARLARLLRALDREALAVPDPARGLARLMDLARTPGPVPLVAAAPDPLLMATFVLERGAGGEAALPLPPGRADEARDAGAPLPEGVRLTDTAVVVDCGGRAAADGPPDAGGRDDRGAAALKELVLRSLPSTSATLAFLRDARVSAIPGLVAEVVVRTRNPQILETVAADRTLHAGFANRAVPAALLRSPVNVSVRTLRRFIHVKYVSKLELKRMAVDGAGIRKEVIREIEKYLATLA